MYLVKYWINVKMSVILKFLGIVYTKSQLDPINYQKLILKFINKAFLQTQKLKII